MPRVSFKSALGGFQEGFRRALGLLPGDLEVAHGAVGGLQEGPRRDRGGHERFELTFSNSLGPSDALSLRFPNIAVP